MAEIKVSNCGNCPFCVIDYDDFAIDNDTVAICGLKKFQGEMFIIGYCDTKFGQEIDYYLPKWCPLGEVTIKRDSKKD